MINKDFIYFMNRWLEGVAYRITLAWWMFTLAGIIALVVAMVTTGYQSIKASLINPVDSLRSE